MIRIVLAVLITALIVPVLMVEGESQAVARLRETQDENTGLRKQIADLERRLTVAETNIATNQVLMKKIFTWFRALPATCEALDGAMNDARKNGFEYAAPNPRAKTNVLDGLKAFAAALESGNPAASPKDSKDAVKK